MNAKLPGGLWPVMLTPFNSSKEIDYTALEELTEFYIATGADGLFANCLSSEMFELTSQERLDITKTVIKIVDGRIPVVSTGSFGQDLSEISEFIKQIIDSGAEAAIISTSQLCPQLADENQFKKKIDSLLDLTKELPLGLYECPYPFKRILSPALTEHLAQTNRFYYLKDTTCSLQPIRAKLEVIKNTNLNLYNANTQTALASLQSDASGLSPIAANFYPELFRYLLDHQSQYNDPDMKKLSNQLSLMEAVIDPIYPLAAKLFLKKRGLTIGPTLRQPTTQMTSEDRDKFNSVFSNFIALTEELGIEVFTP